jgi:hypothetical protein
MQECGETPGTRSLTHLTSTKVQMLTPEEMSQPLLFLPLSLQSQVKQQVKQQASGTKILKMIQPLFFSPSLPQSTSAISRWEHGNGNSVENDARVNILSCFVHVARSVLVCACVCGGGACNERKPLQQLQHLCNSCNTSAIARASGRTSTCIRKNEQFSQKL